MQYSGDEAQFTERRLLANDGASSGRDAVRRARSATGRKRAPSARASANKGTASVTDRENKLTAIKGGQRQRGRRCAK